MMGSQDGEQEQLFYSFSLEDHVPKDHLLRGIDRFLDLSELRGQLAPFYSHTGRPSILRTSLLSNSAAGRYPRTR
jgi:hypothetical protein